MVQYAEDKTIVRRIIEEVVKSVPTCFYGMMICISRSITKCFTIEILELKHFGEHLCLNCTGRYDRSFTLLLE